MLNPLRRDGLLKKVRWAKVVHNGKDVSTGPSSADDSVNRDDMGKGSIFGTHRAGAHNRLDVRHLDIGRRSDSVGDSDKRNEDKV